MNRTNIKAIETPRLILRQWQDSDTAPFIQMCADDEVMRYFLKKLEATEATAFLERIKADIEKRGWGLFAVELKNTGEFISLHVHPPELAFADAPEIGWRLLPQYWHPLQRNILHPIMKELFDKKPTCASFIKSTSIY